MKVLLLPVLALIGYVFVLMGCGQKGPLYMPDKQTPPVITTEATQTPLINAPEAEQTEASGQLPQSTNEVAE